MHENQTLIELILLMTLLGGIAGFLAGLLGVGGGIVTVPGLYYSLSVWGCPNDHIMHVAVGTSLAAICMTGFYSAYTHYKRKNVDFQLLKTWAPAIVVGVVIGAFLASQISGKALTLFFGCFAFVIAGYMGFGKREEGEEFQLHSSVLRSFWACIVGAVSALMGIGGATMSVPILSRFGMPIKRAIGTAAATGFVIAVPGTIGYVLSGQAVAHLPEYSWGFVSIPGAIIIAPASFLTVPLGAATAHRLTGLKLKKLFAVFIACVAMRMMYEAFAL